MASRPMGILLIVAGGLIVLVGLLVSAGWLNWFGRLPGDIRIERDSVKVYIPLASMVVVSVILTVLGWVVRRFWG